MRLFHGSAERFDRFSLARAGRLDRASNGALGVWVSDTPEIASRFGGFLYHIEIDPPRVLEVGISTLTRWHDEAFDLEDPQAFYEQIRLRARGQGYDLIAICEKDGSSPTRIILDPDRIRVLEIEDLSCCPQI